MKQRQGYLLLPLLVLAGIYLAWPEPDRTGTAVSPQASQPLPPPPGENAFASLPEPTAGTSGVEDGSCDIVTHYLPGDDGTVFPAYSCDPAADAPRHPYETYSNAELQSLVYADAKAAEILGMRLRHTDEAQAMSLVLRASALADGDVAPILAYSSAYPQPTSVDGVPVQKTVHVRFVLAAVADLLGGGTDYAAAWEARIRRHSKDPELELELLREKARKIVAEMREIQLEVGGSSTLGGPDDA